MNLQWRRDEGSFSLHNQLMLMLISAVSGIWDTRPRLFTCLPPQHRSSGARNATVKQIPLYKSVGYIDKEQQTINVATGLASDKVATFHPKAMEKVVAVLAAVVFPCCGRLTRECPGLYTHRMFLPEIHFTSPYVLIIPSHN